MLSQRDPDADDVVGRGIERLREDGFLVLESFLEPSFVQDLHIAYVKRISAPLAYAGGLGRSVDKPNVAYVDFPLTLHPNAARLAVCEPVVRIVEGYLEVPVTLSHATAYRTHVVDEHHLRQALRKPGEFSGWHSDANILADNRGYRCVVAMTYLSDVNPGTGSLELVRRSHAYGGRKRAWSEEEVARRPVDRVEVCAPAGSVILFDMEIIHRAGIPRERPRDIIRFMYVPEGGYTEPLVFANSTLPATISPLAARILRLGRPNTVDLPLSVGAPKPSPVVGLVGRARRLARPLLSRVGYYR